MRGLRAALCAGTLLVAQALAPLQAQAEVPLAAEATGMGQAPRPLARNIRGDVAQLLAERADGEQRHAIVALQLAQPAVHLEVQQALRQLDAVTLHCSHNSYQWWRTEVYRSTDPAEPPARVLRPTPGHTQGATLLELTRQQPLLGGALRTLCNSRTPTACSSPRPRAWR
jgi:hypothetical protein